ncbi:MAG: InlB B-repeat-containing protein [Treponema sp.]|nr:InlB B-repeat-containing protein [Treponema sp.]
MKNFKNIILVVLTAVIAGFFSCDSESSTAEKKYTVIYVSEHGSAPEKISVTEDTVLTQEQLPELTDEDYDFCGWFDGETQVKPDEYKVKKDVTLVASWKEKSHEENYTVTFESNGGTPVEPQTVAAWNAAVNPESPEKEGFIFSGWYTDADFTKAFSFSTAVTKDLILYAKWIEKGTVTFNVTFITEAETFVQVVEAGETVTRPTDPVKNGCTFAGWNKGDVLFDFETPVTEELTLTAQWSAITYSIKYENAEENPNTVKEYTVETETIILSDAKKTGWIFDGWYDSPEDGKKVSAIARGSTGNITLYARWTAATNTAYTVEHYRQPDSGLTDLSAYEPVLSENLRGSTGEPTKAEAKTYSGFTAKSFEQQEILSDGSTVVKIYYDRNSHTVTYSDGVEGAVIKVPESKSVLYGTSVSIDFPDETSGGTVGERKGYTFKGWNTKADGTGTLYTNKGTKKLQVPDEDVLLTAQWELARYDIDYRCDGTNPNSVRKYSIESSTIVLQSAQKAGYVFEGWYDAETGGNKVSKIEKGSTGNITLYARWSAASDTTYTVYHYLQPVSGTTDKDGYKLAEDEIEILKGTTGEQTAAVPKIYQGFTAQTVEQQEILSDGSTFVKIYYDRNSYTVTYHDGVEDAEISVPASVTKLYEDKVSVDFKNCGSRMGYTFAGWKDSNGTLYDSNGIKKITSLVENVELMAQWNLDVYEITYEEVDGAENPNTVQSYTYESEDITLLDASKTGWTFLGWNNGLGIITKIQKGSTGNITLTAEWTQIKSSFYTVNHYLQPESGTESLTEYELVEGDSQILRGVVGSETKAVPRVYDGFTAKPVTQNTITEGGFTVISVYYDRNVHSVIYTDGVEGVQISVPQKTDALFGTSVSIDFSTGTRIGYKFKEWNTKADGSGISYTQNGLTEAAVLDEDITLTALWTPLIYRINYEGLEGASNSNTVSSYTIETDDIILSAPEKRGFIFNGWNDGTKTVTKIEKGTTGNITLTATWTLATYSITYEEISGAENPNTVSSYTIETDDITLSAAQKNGYIFKGWKNGTADISVIEKGSSGNIVLTAIWTPVVYSITYEGISGSSNPNTVSSYTIETDDITLSNAEKAGYIFKGWKSNGAYISKIEKGTTGNLILYADFDANIYRIKFMLDGNEYDEKTASYNGTVAEPLDPVDEEKIFDGWYYKNQKYVFTTPVTSDFTLTGHWSEPEQTKVIVTYKTEEGVITGQQVVTAGETFNAPETPVKSGCTFAGWYIGSTRFIFGTDTLSENTVLVQKWTDNSVSVFNVALETASGQNNIELSYNETTKTFSVSGGKTFCTYTWHMDSKVIVGETSGFLVITDTLTSNLSGGNHSVSLYAKDSGGNLWSGSAKFSLRK